MHLRTFVGIFLFASACSPMVVGDQDDDSAPEAALTSGDRPLSLSPDQRGRTLPLFSDMWSVYTSDVGGDVESVKKLIGGDVDDDWIQNTCAIRLSYALNHSGFDIPRGVPGLNTLTGADGKAYAYRVAELTNYLLAAVGQPGLVGVHEADFTGRSGIIRFKISGQTAYTGHFDLWDGTQTAHEAIFGEQTLLWMTSDQPAPPDLSQAPDGGAPDLASTGPASSCAQLSEACSVDTDCCDYTNPFPAAPPVACVDNVCQVHY